MRIKIAFDVDGTLINLDDTPRYDVIRLLEWYCGRPNAEIDVIVWSGGGIDYARRWVEKLGFENLVRVVAKWGEQVDVAYDDCAYAPEWQDNFVKECPAKVIINVDKVCQLPRTFTYPPDDTGSND